MKGFIDSSIFLRLLLDEPGADKAEEILRNIELGRVKAYTTPSVLEEVIFKLIIAKAESILGKPGIWRIREELLHNEEMRRECLEPVKTFKDYILYLSEKGLEIEEERISDWIESINITEEYGVLPRDALYIAVAKRLGCRVIYTFDRDFKQVEGIETYP